MKKNILITSIVVGICLAITGVVSGQSPIFGDGNINTIDQWVTSTSASVRVVTQRIFGRPVKISGLTDGCLELVGGIATTTTFLPCGSGSGGGSSGGPWSTTTSQVSGQLIVYPNNNDDIVTVGSNSTTTAEFFVDPNTATTRFGIGTSSPYATLSVVGQVVGAYFTATTSTASTFPYASSTALTVGGSLYNTSLSDGCVNVTSGLIGSTGVACGAGAGTLDGTGFAGMMASWVDTDTLRATSTIVGSHIHATSTATSTFAGAIRVGDTSIADNLIAVECDRTFSSAASTLGCINIDNTDNARPAVAVYTNATGGSGNGIFVIHSDNVSHSSGLLYIKGDGSNGSDFEIRMDAVNPDLEFIATGQSAPAGNYELDVNSGDDAFRFNGRNSTDSGFYPTFLYQRQDIGGRVCIGCGTPWNTSHVTPVGGTLEVISTTTVANTPSAFFTLSTNVSGRGDVLNVLSNTGVTNGFVGIGTSTPYAKLSVVGQVVASYFTATSSTASRFPYASTTAISVSGLTSGECVQAGTGGLLTTTGGACGSGGGGSAYPFTPTSHYGSINQATTGIAWFQNGINASSTSHIAYASTTYITAETASSTTFIAGRGTSALSSYSFTGDEDTGLYSTGNNVILLAGGNSVLSANNNGITTGFDIDQSSGGNWHLESSAPTVSLPSYSFFNDQNTGLWRQYADALNLTAGGVEVFRSDIASTSIPVGNFGIGTTSPFTKLGVAGTITANNINATSTNATSTFSGNLAFDGEIAPDGTTCATGDILKRVGASDWDCVADSTGTVTGSGATNRVALWSGASALTSNSLVTYDGTTYTIGIGADSGATRILTLKNDGGGNEVFSVAAGGDTLIGINGTGISSALTGIGTSSPQAKLAIRGSSVGLGQATLIEASDEDDNVRFKLNNDGDAYFSNSLGIGSTSPTYSLGVVGSGAYISSMFNTSATGGGLQVGITEGNTAVDAFSVYDTGFSRKIFSAGPTVDEDTTTINAYTNINFPTDATHTIGSATQRPKDIRLSSLAAGGVIFSDANDPTGLLNEDAPDFSYNNNTNSLWITNLFASSTNFGGGNFVHSQTTGTTSIANLETGYMSFLTDAGVVDWINLPVNSAASSLIQSYSAKLDDNSILTVAGTSNGSGAVTNFGLSVGTSTYPTAMLFVTGNNTSSSTMDVFRTASSTGATTFKIDRHGHKVTGGSVPVLSSCGTSPTIAGNDNNGRVTYGTGVTGVDANCTVTFANPWVTAPSCVVNNETQVLLTRASASATVLTISVATFLTDSDVVNYSCEGY